MRFSQRAIGSDRRKSFHISRLLKTPVLGRMLRRLFSALELTCQGISTPRANRYYLPNHVWHLTHRCHKREFLLKFGRDRSRWVSWLFEVRKRFGLSILNYAVTSNHIHLLVFAGEDRQTIPSSLSRWTRVDETKHRAPEMTLQRDGWVLDIYFRHPDGHTRRGPHGVLHHRGELVAVPPKTGEIETPFGHLAYYGPERNISDIDDVSGWNFLSSKEQVRSTASQ